VKPLILSNFDPATDAVIYSNDRGSWNVSRALRDCAAGKHKIYLNDVEECYQASKAVEVDEAKVKLFMAMPDFLAGTVLLGVIEGGAAWFIDGHHRLRAMHRLGMGTFASFIIEEADAAPYQVWYNGQRKPPFKPY
jgi:hypothetical protein